jgi:hypothetical protein
MARQFNTPSGYILAAEDGREFALPGGYFDDATTIIAGLVIPPDLFFTMAV